MVRLADYGVDLMKTCKQVVMNAQNLHIRQSKFLLRIKTAHLNLVDNPTEKHIYTLGRHSYLLKTQLAFTVAPTSCYTETNMPQLC
jgi:hypothetical protein